MEHFREILLSELLKCNSQGILLIALKSCRYFDLYSWKKSDGLGSRVIGSGTLLDSASFRYLIGQNQRIDPRSIHAHIIGEHGDSEIPVWSLANVAGTDLELDEETQQDIFDRTKNAAYEIINAKGATSYAIALALDRIVAAILGNEGSVLNVSTYLEDYNGVSDVYLGVPCVVDRNGVREILPLPLNETEKVAFQASVTN